MSKPTRAEYLISLSETDDALCWDPFEGDRDVVSTTLRNRIIRTRAEHKCHLCACCIPEKTRGVRSMTQVFDGMIGTWWWCPLCVDAMRRDDEWGAEGDDGPEIGPWTESPPTVRRGGLRHLL